MTNTKEKILVCALSLFAANGFEAVSIREIAESTGMTKSALYKHYAGKRDVFESILERMNQLDAEYAGRYEMPSDVASAAPQSYENTDLHAVKEFALAQLRRWTEQGFSRDFRRLLTLEQYRGEQMSALYSQYISGGPVDYMADVLRRFCANEREAKALAVEFYAPMFLLYSLCDAGMSTDEALSMLETQLDAIINKLENKKEENK